MKTRFKRVAAAVLFAACALLAVAGTAAAATGTTTINYGPYTIPAGNGDPHGHDGMGMIENQLTMNVQRPCSGSACTVTGMKANLVYSGGATANWNTEVMLHHMVLLASGTGHTDSMCPAGFGGVSGSQFTERIFASGNERTPVDFTGSNYGVKLGASDQLHLVVDLMNIKTTTQTVYVQVEYKWATGSDNTARTGVRPVWMDVDGCGDSQYNAPFGLSDQTYDATAPVTGALVGAAGHLHDHSLNLQVENVNRGGDLCVSLPGFGESAGFIDTSLPTGRKRISSMSACAGSPAGWMTQGDTLRMHARYYAGPEHSHAVEGAMGIMLGYVDTTRTPPSTGSLPSVSIASPADDSTGTANAVDVAFSTTGATSVTCKVNRLAAVPCTSPVSVASLLGTATVADGAYTVQVAASNAAGTRSRTVSFAVDTAAPAISIPDPAEGQVLTSSSTSLHLLIADANVFTANCSLDGAPATDCTVTDGHGHIPLSGLATGTHTFTVNATDSLGHSSSLVRTFSVSAPPTDTTAPVVTITSPAAGASFSSSSVTVRFTATDNVGVTGTTCQLAGPVSSAEAPCTSPKSYTGLARGSYTVTVRARDAAGNVGLATRSFRRR
ncbi:MAG: hypothetical protein HZB14_05535 [Actinobacteria bacterium]|nr:hypothetical protein [Actinomycetota bacterium]